MSHCIMEVHVSKRKSKTGIAALWSDRPCWVGDKTFEEQIEDSLKGGVTCIQLREKS